MEEQKSSQNPAIKITLNGKERPFTEETVIRDWKAASEQASATASEDQTEDDDFDWILPKEEHREVPEFKLIHTEAPKKKRPNRNWKFKSSMLHPNMKGFIISFCLAVVIGVGMGIFILKISKTENTAPVVGTETTPPSGQTEEEGNQIVEHPVKFPAWKIAVIQGGVFSAQEKADATAKELKNEGYASIVIPIDNMYYLFFGVAGQLQTAKTWEVSLKEQGVNNGEVYAKELDIGQKEIIFSSEEEGNQFSKVINNFSLIADEAVNIQTSGKTNESVIKDALALLEKEADKTYASSEANELSSKLTIATNSLMQYTSSANKEELFKAQQALLDYIKIYFGISA
ncbi:hypothetical protein [Bacillus niameyensis]|uniref:hypothetical protein n=1 Tax=Bacillus niameyensis TaxID=1522308 RepID=UPI000780396A|nr:hypothetical protein [Bacillus niameyensis]